MDPDCPDLSGPAQQPLYHRAPPRQNGWAAAVNDSKREDSFGGTIATSPPPPQLTQRAIRPSWSRGRPDLVHHESDGQQTRERLIDVKSGFWDRLSRTPDL